MKGGGYLKGMDLSILFGITGGLLSLVGLIAIFVTMNAQQNIEKAREVLWSLQSFYLQHRSITLDSEKKLSWYYNHYRDLTRTKFNFTRILVILLACLTIVFVGFSWLYFIFRHHYTWKVQAFAIIACFILFLFVLLLLWLIVIPKVGSLPTHEQLFSLNLDSDRDHKITKNKLKEIHSIDMERIFAENIHCKVTGTILTGFSEADFNTWYDIEIRLPFPVDYKQVEMKLTALGAEGYHEQYGILNPTIDEQTIKCHWVSEKIVTDEQLELIKKEHLKNKEENESKDFVKYSWETIHIFSVTLQIDRLILNFYSGKFRKMNIDCHEIESTVLAGFEVGYEQYTDNYKYLESNNLTNKQRDSKIKWVENEDS